MDIRQFATARELEYIDSVERHGSQRGAARALGVVESSIRGALKRLHDRAARQGWAPEHDMTRTVPDGFRVKGVSTYYDKDGTPAGQWVKSQVDQERQDELMREAVAALCETIKPVKPIKSPKDSLDHLMSVYPVGDHHIGQLSWHPETGKDYDTQKAETLLMGAMDHLVDSAPASTTGMVVLLGDFLHYDSYSAVTPQSKNQLDADTRYPKIVRVAMRTIRYAITAALKKHQEVLVIVASGNHDPVSMVWLREAINALYENEPRVTVDDSPSMFHYHKFGDVLIGVHHGDKVRKYENLAMLMAADRPKEWGATKHRHFYMGHIHHDRVRDMAGVTVESFSVLSSADAWAHGAGYRPMEKMKRIDYHKKHGEVARQTVTPEMLDG